ncbi:MAG: hypothetical protein ABSA83_23830 [Verrucomicrobiota bacterium]|jgi:hypothetical protein
MRNPDLKVAVLVLCAGVRVSALEAISNCGHLGFSDFAGGGASFGFTPVVNISAASRAIGKTALPTIRMRRDGHVLFPTLGYSDFTA